MSKSTRFPLLFLTILTAAPPVFARAPAHSAAKPQAAQQQVQPASARQLGIAAVVNQDAISMSDLGDRMHLLLVSSGLPDSPDLRARMTGQAINSLIEEQLMLQEAKKDGVEITDKDIDDGFAQLAAQNKTPPEQFKAMIEGAGVNIATMRRQIKAQLAWGKVIQKTLRSQVQVTDADIDEYLNHLNASKGKTEYLVAEIFLPVDAPADDGNVKQLADKLVAEMRGGQAPFVKVAQQFSKAPGAAQGGDRGWLQEGQLPQELDSVLKNMKKEELSEPIRAADGYHILFLRDERALTDQDIPDRDKVMSQIGLQRLDLLQRRTMMDLRSSAFIENRVQS